jgi:glycosyltransferase involved in cell wall biosynthesis
VNDSFRRYATENGLGVTIYNTAGPGLDRSFTTRLRRMARVLRSLSAFACRPRRNSFVYMSSSAGYAVLYEVLFCVLARLRGSQVVVHHHSYRYLNNWFWPMMLLRKIAGSSAYHVLLSEGMAAKFQSQYGATKCLCISNSAFIAIDPLPKVSRRSSAVVIGLLSNLTEDKGVNEFFELAAKARALSKEWHFRLAGPFPTTARAEFYRDVAVQAGNIDIVGPLYGEEKDQFYQCLDVFVFPSKLSEAEPLVVLEALQHSVPVIAWGRGTIPEILEGCGVVIPPEASFPESAYRQIIAWESDPTRFLKDRQLSRSTYENLCCKGRTGLQQLMTSLSGSLDHSIEL